MKGFRNRAAEKARRAASGGDGPPAGQDPQPTGAPTTADRGATRKRLREARRNRDAVLHELGALVMEMHRQQRHDASLVERKAREAIAADAEARSLAAALDWSEPLTDVSAPTAPIPAAPPAASDRVEAPPIQAAPPSAGDRVSAPDSPPPAASDRVDAAPPSPGDRVDTPPSSGDGVPTYTVTR